MLAYTLQSAALHYDAAPVAAAALVISWISVHECEIETEACYFESEVGMHANLM